MYRPALNTGIRMVTRGAPDVAFTLTDNAP
jgi:hypothetical protein